MPETEGYGPGAAHVSDHKLETVYESSKKHDADVVSATDSYSALPCLNGRSDAVKPVEDHPRGGGYVDLVGGWSEAELTKVVE